MRKSDWKCKKCGGETDQDDGVCMVCRTDETVIRGYAKGKVAKAAVEAERKPKSEGGAVRSAGLSDALCRGLDLETEGRGFYLKCADGTTDKEGKGMFAYLASEEKVHYDKIAAVFREYDAKGFRNYVEEKGLMSGVFKGEVKGGKLSGKSDALDALNIGIAAEEKSIMLYDNLSKTAPTREIRALFSKLVEEEKRHKNILENEVEFVTDTGEFHDFKTVTM